MRHHGGRHEGLNDSGAFKRRSEGFFNFDIGGPCEVAFYFHNFQNLDFKLENV